MLIYPAVLLLSTAPPAAPDGTAMYAKMAVAMSAVRPPAVATYDETFYPRGLTTRTVETNGVQVVHLVFSSTDKSPHLMHVTQCGNGDTTRVADASGQDMTIEQPFWSAVWSHVAQTSVPGEARQRMLADLTIASDDAYAVTVAAPETIDGSPAYHLKLVAKHDATAHPLTDVFLDEQSMLPRRAVADFQDNAVAHVTGDVTVNFGRVRDYWIVSSGEVDATVRAFGTQTSGSAAFAAENVALAAGPCPASP